MRRVRCALAFLAGVALVAAGTARSQPGSFGGPAPPTPTPLAVVLLNGIDDPAVVAELKLTDAQVASLVARRQAVWDEVYNTAPARADDAARVAATDAALKKTLTPQQYKRAVQLGGQRVAAGPFGFGTKGKAGGPPAFTLRVTAATLKGYPELAAVVKLSEAQQKALADPLGTTKGGFPVFGGLALTPEQQAAVREFLGPVLPTRWVAKFDPRLAAIPDTPTAIGLLDARDVRADVALTADQDKAIAALREKWAKLDAGRAGELSPKEAHAAGTALHAETEAALAATLKAEQATRLKQIQRRTATWAGGKDAHVEDFYTQPASAKEFELAPEQVAALDDVWAAYRVDAAKAFEAGGPHAATEARVKELAASRRTKAEAVLTSAQAAKVRDAFGAEFTGSTIPDAARRGGFNPAEMRAATFGKYSGELNTLAGSAAIQAELKLTPGQVKKTQDLRDDLAAKYRGLNPFADPDAFARLTAERSAAVEAGLKEVLTTAEAARFREIMLQARERTAAAVFARGGISTTVESAAAYPGVAEAIGLTGDQRNSLVAGSTPAEVLTTSQKAAITKLLGAPFDPSPTSAPRPLNSPYMTIFNRPDGEVGAALGLTPEQTAAVGTARSAYQEKVRVLLPAFGTGLGGNVEDTVKALAPAVEAFDAAVEKTLNPAQKTRLPQVALQVRAAADLRAALTAPDAAKGLDLAADQRARLSALADEAVRVQNLVVTSRADTPDQRLALRLRDAADERMLAVLSDAQRAAWRGLTGEPVPGLRKTIPGRFGPGGFGGAGGGGFFPGGGFGGGPGFPF